MKISKYSEISKNLIKVAKLLKILENVDYIKNMSMKNPKCVGILKTFQNVEIVSIVLKYSTISKKMSEIENINITKNLSENRKC